MLVFLVCLFAIQGIASVHTAEPVGLMLTPAEAVLVRDGSSSPVKARAGDLLYAGDVIRSAGFAATFLYCPGKSTLTLAPSTEVLLDSSQLTINKGAVQSKVRVMSCYLPPVVRLAVASSQKYGVLVSRGEPDTTYQPTPRSKWPEGLAQKMSSIELALTVNPHDSAAVLARATLFEAHGLWGDALNDYNQLKLVWTDTDWLEGKIADMKRALATRPVGSRIYSDVR
jgi:hypothetical protein